MGQGATNGTGRRAVVRAAGLACGLAGAPAFVRAQSGRLRVGVLLPRTGALAPLGLSCVRGAETGADVIRELMGVNLELLHADTASSVGEARARADRLIGDGAQAIVGPVDSAAAASVATLCEQRRVPFVVNVAADPQLTERGLRYTFRVFPTSHALVRDGLSACRELFQATRTAPRSCVLLHPSDAPGLATRKAVEAALPTLDFLPFRIVDAIGVDAGGRDLASAVARARAANADFAMPLFRRDGAIALVREMVRQRYETQGLVSPGAPGMYEEGFYRALGRHAEFCVTNVPWPDPRSRITAAVERAFARRYPGERLMFQALNVGYTVEALLVLADGFRRAGSAGGNVLADALRKTSLDERMMLGGPLRFDARGQATGHFAASIQNRKGRPALVLPASSAELAPVFPMPGWDRRG